MQLFYNFSIPGLRLSYNLFLSSAWLASGRPDASPRPGVGTYPASCVSCCACSCLVLRLPNVHDSTRLPAELELPRQDGGKGSERRERRGEGVVRRASKAQGRKRSPMVGHCPPATDAITACVTSDLLLEHLDEKFATYV